MTSLQVSLCPSGPVCTDGSSAAHSRDGAGAGMGPAGSRERARGALGTGLQWGLGWGSAH